MYIGLRYLKYTTLGIFLASESRYVDPANMVAALMNHQWPMQRLCSMHASSLVEPSGCLCLFQCISYRNIQATLTVIVLNIANVLPRVAAVSFSSGSV